MPRYLRVAQWLYEQQAFMSARELAPLFNVEAKRITDDFARIRKHHHIFKTEEQRIPIQGGYKYRVRVLYIAPYRMDGRNFPILLKHYAEQGAIRPSQMITWADLLSSRWRDLGGRINSY
ncbi:hypothetical protein [Aeromonas sp.]|uniref:hypothetical protein n=1 Tax=Aeromonas sp. TaxID=647 RepID=UPI0025875E77|nr:hypothetical protein [Aeromonas sp.]MCX7127735.1 hypothetical protein [Aeromonas sp.]